MNRREFLMLTAIGLASSGFRPSGCGGRRLISGSEVSDPAVFGSIIEQMEEQMRRTVPPEQEHRVRWRMTTGHDDYGDPCGLGVISWQYQPAGSYCKKF